MGSLVLEIQDDALKNDISTLQVLRKLNAAAVKLQLSDVSEWVQSELNGYQNTQYEALPENRRLRGDPRCQNPYHGWQPLRASNGDSDFHMKLSEFSLRQPVAEIENLIRSARSREIYFNFSPRTEAGLQDGMAFRLPIALSVPVSSLVTVLEDIRNKALNIALELETKGILGENMSFSKEDKQRAANITFNVNAQTVGSVSNASDFAQVTNANDIFSQAGDSERLSELVDQLRQASSGLPEDEQKKVLLLTDQLETNKEDPEKSAGALQSIKNVCEGVAGNITAQGILAAISNFL